MKKIFTIGMIILGLLILIGCEESPDEPEPEIPSRQPENLSYVTYEDSVRLIWNSAEAETLNDFVGYNVYFQAIYSIVDRTPDSLPVPDNHTFITETEHVVHGLTAGTRYYFHVRGIWGSVVDTATSREVETSPVIEGIDTVWEYDSDRYSAFYFAGGHPLSMSSTLAESIDVYLDIDTTTNRRVLRSPHLVENYHDVSPGVWDDRRTQIDRLGDGDWRDFNVHSDANWGSYQEEVTAGAQVFAIHNEVNNYYVKMVIETPGGTPPNRFIVFRYAYQPKTGYDRF